MSSVPAIRREILVDAEPAVAFEVFTAGIGQWWPVEEHSVYGKGPLGDADAEGMTILRLPGPGRLAEATRLATEDDASVAGGFFAVTVRPWQVMMRAEP